MGWKFANFAQSTLSDNLDPATGVAYILSADVAKFPALAEGDKFACVLFDGAQDPEVVYVTAINGTALTILRGQEASGAKRWQTGTAILGVLTMAVIYDLGMGFQQDLYDSLVAQIAALAAQTQDDVTTLTADMSQMSTRIDGVQTQADEATASAQAAQLAVSDQTAALAEYKTEVEATYGGLPGEVAGLTADVTDESIARASADGALGGRITTVTSGVGGDVQAQQAILAGYTVAQRSYTDYFVKLDADGVFAGFELEAADGTTTTVSEATFYVEHFTIQKPGAPTTFQPFNYDATTGTLYLQSIVVDWALITNAMITNAQIVNLSASKITTGTLSASIAVGTGGLLYVDDGTVARYIGDQFGTTSQFYDWFGPSPGGPSAASETNAYFYIKTDGTVFFGASKFIIGTPSSPLQPFVYDSGSGLLTLANLQVDGALIKQLTVQTIHIANAAVTNPGPGPFSAAGPVTIGTSDTLIATRTITTTGGTVTINCVAQTQLQTNTSSTSSINDRVEVYIKRNGTTVYRAIAQNAYTTIVGSVTVILPVTSLVSPAWSETPAAGTYTYEFGANVVRSDNAIHNAFNIFMDVKETLK